MPRAPRPGGRRRSSRCRRPRGSSPAAADRRARRGSPGRWAGPRPLRGSTDRCRPLPKGARGASRGTRLRGSGRQAHRRHRPLSPPPSRVTSTVTPAHDPVSGKWPRLGVPAVRPSRTVPAPALALGDDPSPGRNTRMALFTDEPSANPAMQERRSLGERIGWGALTVAVVIGVVFALLPAPYVIEQPGPVYDTLGVAKNGDDEEVPLIEIPDATTYPTDGELNLLTVSVVGRPGQTPNWFEVVGAWFDRTRSVVPVEAIFPPGVSNEDRDAQNQAAMVDSQQDAIAGALVELGYDFPREVTVAGLLEESPAEGIIEEGDVILSLDGTEVYSIGELQQAVRENGSESPASIVILRDG